MVASDSIGFRKALLFIFIIRFLFIWKNTLAQNLTGSFLCYTGGVPCVNRETCEKNCTFVEGSQVCPLGYELKPEGNCIRTLLPLCRPGTKKYGDKCYEEKTEQLICRQGFLLRNGKCINETEGECPPGTNLEFDSCIRRTPTSFICPTGSIEAGNKCIMAKCPLNYTLTNGTCHPEVTKNCKFNCTNVSCSNPNECNRTCGCEDINKVWNNENREKDTLIPKEITNIINNHNNVSHYLNRTISVNNVNTVHIYSNGQIVKNNVPEVYNTNYTQLINGTESNCCTIITPRICRMYDYNWRCYNRRYYRCGVFCTRSVIHLNPRGIINRRTMLIRPFPNNGRKLCQEKYCKSVTDFVDCSGCKIGQMCSTSCYLYSCPSDSCILQDQREFCTTFGGLGCSIDDGCLENWCP